MKIGIVDDDAGKSGTLLEFLKTELEVDEEQIFQFADSSSCLSAVANREVGLLFVDCRLPKRFGMKPDIEGGLKLLRGLRADGFCDTLEAIGVTGFKETAKAQDHEFAVMGLRLLEVSGQREDWKPVVKGAVERHLVRTEIRWSDTLDVLVVVAIDGLEASAILALIDPDESAFEISDFGASARIVRRGLDSLRELRIGIVSLDEMGPVAAGVVACAAIKRFCPSLVVSAGIAGGISKDVKIGDVVVADQVWSMENGKRVDGNGPDDWFQPEMKVVASGGGLRQSVRKALRGSKFSSLVLESWKNSDGAMVSKLHFGPVACSSAVIGSSKSKSAILERERKTLAVEMEAYGVGKAVERELDRSCDFLVIKGISDLADSDKGDFDREFAAHAMAVALREVIDSDCRRRWLT